MSHKTHCNQVTDAFDRIDEALSGFTFESNGVRPSPAADRWVLASNLQKAIRRGMSGTAALTSHWMHDVDPSYVWQRLMVIAYEDIGLADGDLCRDVLAVCRSTQFQRSRGRARVAAYLATRLADARKSRSLCDLSVILEMQQRRDHLRSTMTALSPSELTAISCNESLPTLRRAAALRELAGYRITTYRVVEAFVRPTPSAMSEIADRLRLSPTHRTLYLEGQRGAEGMNAFVPLVAQTNNEATSTNGSFKFEGVRGVLFSAIDKHTRVGGRCIAALLRERKELRDFFSSARRPVAAFGSVLFFVEGGLLNISVTGKDHDDWARQCEAAFIESNGLEREKHGTAHQLVTRHLSRLNELRSEELA